MLYLIGLTDSPGFNKGISRKWFALNADASLQLPARSVLSSWLRFITEALAANSIKVASIAHGRLLSLRMGHITIRFRFGQRTLF